MQGSQTNIIGSLILGVSLPKMRGLILDNEIKMINFYYVDKAYADFLRQYDTKVPVLDYDGYNKFFCGIVLKVNEFNYYAPISHETQKQQTNIIITDKNRAIASIKFSFMLPVIPCVLTRLDFNEIAKEDINYANLLRAEYSFCSKNKQVICKKAQSVYRIGCNNKHKLYDVCCKFKILEKHINEFNS